MHTREDFNARMRRCADIVFKQSDAQFGVDRRSSVSLKTLACTIAAPTLLKANGFKLWLEYPSINTLPDWLEKNISDAPLDFLVEHGVFQRTEDKELVLADSFPKSSMLHSTLSCNKWIKRACVGLIGTCLRAERGHVGHEDVAELNELGTQLAAFAGGLSHFEDTMTCVESMREVCAKLVAEDVDQIDFYSAHEEVFQTMTDAFFKLEEQCSAQEDGTESRLVALMTPGHDVDSINTMMAGAASQMVGLMKQIQENGFSVGGSHKA